MKKAFIIILVALISIFMFVSCEEGNLLDVCTIKYDGNGSTSGTMPDQICSKGSEIKLSVNAFERTGYKFNGWNTQADGKGSSYADGATIKAEANLVLYAQWTDNSGTGSGGTGESVKIIFNANGGTGTMNTFSAKAGETTKLPANSFKKDGSSFSGWAVTKGGEVVYADQGTIKAEKDITLYAVWKAASGSDGLTTKVTITFNANGGSGEMKTFQAKVGEDTKLPANTYTKDGSTFIGWAVAKDGDAVYANQGTIKVNTDITLYAVWKAASGSDGSTTKVTITFNANGGTGIMDPMEVEPGSYVALPDCTFTKDGVSFLGWGGADLVVAYSAGQTITVSGNLTLYAIWGTPATQSKVTFETNGGTIEEGSFEKYTEGTAKTLPTNVKKTDYYFGGWYDNSGLTGSAVTSITATDTGDKTFYAKWLDFPTSLTSGTYVVSKNITVDSRISVGRSSRVFIVINSGCTLTASKGFSVPMGSSLNILGAGELIATGEDNKAGIGGAETLGDNPVVKCGTIIINEGYESYPTTVRVIATGGANAAGIGGDYQAEGGNVIISGGTVLATGGSNAVGIGMGADCTVTDHPNGQLTVDTTKLEVLYKDGGEWKTLSDYLNSNRHHEMMIQPKPST